jgi:hypothetical protein
MAKKPPWPDSEGATMNANDRSAANRTPPPPVRRHTARKIRTGSVQIRPFLRNEIYNLLHTNYLKLYYAKVYGFSSSTNSPTPRRAAQLTETDQNRPIFQGPVTPDVRRGLKAVSRIYCTTWDKTGRFANTQNPDRCATGTCADAQPDCPILPNVIPQAVNSPERQNRIKLNKTE